MSYLFSAAHVSLSNMLNISNKGLKGKVVELYSHAFFSDLFALLLKHWALRKLKILKKLDKSIYSFKFIYFLKEINFKIKNKKCYDKSKYNYKNSSQKNLIFQNIHGKKVLKKSKHKLFLQSMYLDSLPCRNSLIYFKTCLPLSHFISSWLRTEPNILMKEMIKMNGWK